MFPLFDPTFPVEPPEFIVDNHSVKSGVFLQFYSKILDFNLWRAPTSQILATKYKISILNLIPNDLKE